MLLQLYTWYDVSVLVFCTRYVCKHRVSGQGYVVVCLERPKSIGNLQLGLSLYSFTGVRHFSTPTIKFNTVAVTMYYSSIIRVVALRHLSTMNSKLHLYLVGNIHRAKLGNTLWYVQYCSIV